MRGPRFVRGERTVEDGDVNSSTKPDQVVAILRISRVGQRFPAIVDPITDAMEIRHMGHGSWSDLRSPDCKAPVSHFLEGHAKRGA